MKLNNSCIAILFFIILPVMLFSADKTISLQYPIKDLPQANTNNNNGGYSSNNNSSTSMEKAIVDETSKNNFEMNADETIFQKTINDTDRYNKMLSETLSLEYLMTPEVRPFKSMDTIYIHPNHITTIVLPEDVELKTAKSSFPTELFELNENSILIKPSRAFNTGNIVITATNKKENYLFNILVRKIENSIVSFDNDYNKYLIENNYLSLVYKYERKQIEGKYEILQKYLKLNNIKSYDLDVLFEKEGDYDMLISKGITYYIIRDDRFGYINYGDVNFRVDTKYSISQESHRIKSKERR